MPYTNVAVDDGFADVHSRSARSSASLGLPGAAGSLLKCS